MKEHENLTTGAIKYQGWGCEQSADDDGRGRGSESVDVRQRDALLILQ